MQRIPRYVLLLKELKKSISPEEEAYNDITVALTKMEQVAAEINKFILESERKLALFRMGKVLENYSSFKSVTNDDGVAQVYRSLIQEGMLTKVCRKMFKERYFVLFNDILVYGEGNDKSVKISSIIQLTPSVKLTNYTDTEKIKNAFVIESKESSFIAFAKTPEEKEQWFNNLSLYIKNAEFHIPKEQEEKERKAVVRSVFVPDSEVSKCQLCGSEFTFVKRRHHCRKCGKCICGDCSLGKMPFSNSSQEEKVCNTCYNEYMISIGKPNKVIQTKKVKKGEKNEEKVEEKSEGVVSSEVSEANDNENKEKTNEIKEEVHENKEKIEDASSGNKENEVQQEGSITIEQIDKVENETKPEEAEKNANVEENNTEKIEEKKQERIEERNDYRNSVLVASTRQNRWNSSGVVFNHERGKSTGKLTSLSVSADKSPRTNLCASTPTQRMNTSRSSFFKKKASTTSTPSMNYDDFKMDISGK